MLWIGDRQIKPPHISGLLGSIRTNKENDIEIFLKGIETETIKGKHGRIRFFCQWVVN